ncbi:MAG: hypothetical protein IM628_12720 [Phenylobacterium sp.]|uniref:hypothetical protein n=1 Tax=Phenylobacterium sp. TaxID=1871053 RepID=UPI0025DF23B7|nr:hypothetical protein [Phenylobacterium sp.]MCA6305661.1 hypothetical protein [Phenylobacterium sp.]
MSDSPTPGIPSHRAAVPAPVPASSFELLDGRLVERAPDPAPANAVRAAPAPKTEG